jgi:hypothetical protein
MPELTQNEIDQHAFDLYDTTATRAGASTGMSS